MPNKRHLYIYIFFFFLTTLSALHVTRKWSLVYQGDGESVSPLICLRLAEIVNLQGIGQSFSREFQATSGAHIHFSKNKKEQNRTANAAGPLFISFHSSSLSLCLQAEFSHLACRLKLNHDPKQIRAQTNQPFCEMLAVSNQIRLPSLRPLSANYPIAHLYLGQWCSYDGHSRA